MDVAGALQPDLAVRIPLMNVWFSWNTDRDSLIANGDGNCVVIVPVNDDGIAGIYADAKDIYIVIMKGKMVMGLVVHANELGEDHTGNLSPCGRR